MKIIIETNSMNGGLMVSVGVLGEPSSPEEGKVVDALKDVIKYSIPFICKNLEATSVEMQVFKSEGHVPKTSG